jgi:hypothetical protein
MPLQPSIEKPFLKFLTSRWQDWRMRKVPYFAGVALLGGSVVVALNWGARAPMDTPYAMPVPSPWSVNAETVQLFSAFGAEAETPKPARPRQLSPPSDVKLPPKKPSNGQPSIKASVKSTKDNQKRPPAFVNASGHIL